MLTSGRRTARRKRGFPAIKKKNRGACLCFSNRRISSRKLHPGNYSLTSVTGKVMEQLALDAISKQLEKRRRSSGIVSMDSPRENHA